MSNSARLAVLGLTLISLATTAQGKISPKFQAQESNQIADHAPLPGDKIAPFTVSTEDGGVFEWNPGRVTLFSVCAYWCDTWKTQLKRFANANQMLNGLPVDFVALSIDGRWTELGSRAPYLKGLQTVKDPGGAWSHSLGITTVPYTFIVDSSGAVRWAGQGIRRSDEMADEARRALQPPGKGGTVYLTFDDFPKPNADQLLDVLRNNDACATFFCVCSRAAQNAALLKRAVEDGDSVQIHAWDHDDPDLHLDKCETTLLAADGQPPTLLRKPGKEAISRLGGQDIHLFTVDPYDYQRPGVHELLRRVLSAVRPDCVIQLHAGVSDTLTALPEIIAGIRRQGLTLGVLR